MLSKLKPRLRFFGSRTYVVKNLNQRKKIIQKYKKLVVKNEHFHKKLKTKRGKTNFSYND